MSTFHSRSSHPMPRRQENNFTVPGATGKAFLGNDRWGSGIELDYDVKLGRNHSLEFDVLGSGVEGSFTAYKARLPAGVFLRIQILFSNSDKAKSLLKEFVHFHNPNESVTTPLARGPHAAKDLSGSLQETFLDETKAHFKVGVAIKKNASEAKLEEELEGGPRLEYTVTYILSENVSELLQFKVNILSLFFRLKPDGSPEEVRGGRGERIQAQNVFLVTTESSLQQMRLHVVEGGNLFARIRKLGEAEEGLQAGHHLSFGNGVVGNMFQNSTININFPAKPPMTRRGFLDWFDSTPAVDLTAEHSKPLQLELGDSIVGGTTDIRSLEHPANISVIRLKSGDMKFFTAKGDINIGFGGVDKIFEATTKDGKISAHLMPITRFNHPLSLNATATYHKEEHRGETHNSAQKTIIYFVCHIPEEVQLKTNFQATPAKMEKGDSNVKFVLDRLSESWEVEVKHLPIAGKRLCL
ncbi:hypothetical protein T439DRAFT_43277 [Meredithblackwellia eburnea MCA 4105]